MRVSERIEQLRSEALSAVASGDSTAALEDVRGKGLVVVPLCPFIARYIQHHPEYHDLVATS